VNSRPDIASDRLQVALGDLLRCRSDYGPGVSALVIVLSVDRDVRYICATGRYAGRVQTVTHRTLREFYEQVM